MVVVARRLDMEDAAELALVRETQVVAVVKFDGEMFESKWVRGSGDNLKDAGHAEVNRQECLVVQYQEEEFGAADDVEDRTVDDAGSGRLNAKIADHSFECARAQTGNPAMHDHGEQPGPDGFDFGEFWHTGTLVGPGGRRASACECTSTDDLNWMTTATESA